MKERKSTGKINKNIITLICLVGAITVAVIISWLSSIIIGFLGGLVAFLLLLYFLPEYLESNAISALPEQSQISSYSSPAKSENPLPRKEIVILRPRRPRPLRSMIPINRKVGFKPKTAHEKRLSKPNAPLEED